MGYSVVWAPKAKDELKKLDKEIARRIVAKSKDLEGETDPRHFLEQMVGSELWKLKVGDWRALVDINDSLTRIEVLKVGHRKKIYKRA